MAGLLLLPSLAAWSGLELGVASLSLRMSGSEVHSLFEWLGVGLTAAGAGAYALHFRVHREPLAGLVSLALFLTGVLDSLHVLASNGLLGSVGLPESVAPFTFACSRLGSGVALLLGLGIWLLLLQKPRSVAGQRAALISTALLMSVCCGLCAFWMTAFENVPRTTFPNAVISRPFDVVPLALLLLVVTLAWAIRSRTQSRLASGVMLSTVPAVLAQVHIAFGASALYDTHFHLAHFFKDLSYLALLGSALADLLPFQATSRESTQRGDEQRSLSSGMSTSGLPVGVATRPLGLVLPVVAFVFTFIMVLLVGLSFYTESERLVDSQKWAQVSEQGEALVPLVENIFNNADAGILFLGKTLAELQAVEVQFEGDDASPSSRTAIEGAFLAMLQSNPAFQQLRYFRVVEGVPHGLARVKRTANGIVRVPETHLGLPVQLGAIEQALVGELGQVFYSRITFTAQGDGWISLAVPVYAAKHDALVGIVEAELGLSSAIAQLARQSFSAAEFSVLTESGRVLFSNAGSGNARKLLGDSESEELEVRPTARVLATAESSAQGRPRLLISVVFPSDETHQTLVDFRNRAFALGASLALLALALALVASSRIVRPLRRLSEALEHQNDPAWLEQLPVNAKDEVGVLARGFRNLFSQLDGAMRQQRAALLSAQNQRQALDEHAIVAMTDVDGSIIYANDRFCEISGYQEDELIGRNHSVVGSQSHNKQFWQAMYASLSAGRNWHQQICNRKKNGELYWVNSTVVPFMGEDGRPESYVSIATDITESVLAERELARSVALLAATLDSTADGILVVDLSGKVLQANERLCTLFEWSREELFIDEGRALRWHIASQFLEPKLFTLVEDTLRDHPEESVAEVLKFTGDRIFERDSRAMMIAGNLEGFVFSYRDVSARTKSQRELVAAKDAAEEASKQKADFLASMSHEIRTPMNGVLGMLGLLLDGELQAEQRHEAELARSSAEALLGLINDILDFSKVEAGKLDLEEIEFDLCTELGEFSEAMALRCEDKGLSLVLDMVGVETSSVVGDPGRLRQILMNLVGNAVKFTSRGEILLSLRTEPHEQGLRLVGTVRDNGIGIPEDKIPILFDKFTQVDASTTRKYGGSGLGLAIVGQLCQLMGGGVSVKSVLGEGSEFVFEVVLRSSSSPEQPVPEMGGRTVLVVDEGSLLRASLSNQLKAWGAEVATTGSYESAIALIRGTFRVNYDYLFCDFQHHEDASSNFARLVHEQPELRGTRLIAMTTMRRRLREAECAKRGFDASFPKPITRQDLVGVLTAKQTRSSEVLALPPSIVPASVSRSTWGETSAGSLRLLIVEDNPVNQKVARGTLHRLGYYLTDIAGNGYEALEALRNAPVHAPYDLVLMDCQMPEMDGYEAVRKIRQGIGGARYKDLPVIAMTANAMTGDREKCLSAGMSDYLTKPVQRLALQETLEKWLPRLHESLPMRPSESPYASETSQEGE